MQNDLNIFTSLNHEPSSGSFANDNANWVADLKIATRMFTETYRRYRQIDPNSLTPKQRVHRAAALYWSLDAIRLCWREWSASE
jgi:hypothetical protein